MFGRWSDMGPVMKPWIMNPKVPHLMISGIAPSANRYVYDGTCQTLLSAVGIVASR